MWQHCVFSLTLSYSIFAAAAAAAFEALMVLVDNLN
jgi:hypothetical protein